MKLPCPRCSREVEDTYNAADHRRHVYFFKCKYDNCRNHFRVVEIHGLPLQVTSMSPPVGRKPEPRIGQMGCPTCGAYGKIKTSFKREDGYWRRHQCPACGPYFTCEPVDPEQGISVHRKMKALHQIDNN